MNVEAIDKMARLVPTISALLTGFSFSMITRLLFQEGKERLTTATLISFLASGAAMLVVTFNSTYLLITIAVSGGHIGPADSAAGIAEVIIHVTKWIFYGGIACLFTGGALLGWLQSKAVGIFGTVIMTVAASAILVTILLLGV